MPEPTRETFRLIACQTLSHETRSDTYVQEGTTVGQALRDLGWKTDKVSARVFIDGQLVPDAEWLDAEPKSGQAVVVRRVLSGGGGGNTGKQIGMIVGMLALMVAAFYAGPAIAAAIGVAETVLFAGITAANAITAGIMVAGSLALNALIAPSRPRLDRLSELGFGSQTLSLTGSSNEANPYGRIPRLYGKHRIYPPLAARPYTEVVGNQQYMRFLFCLGYGPLEFVESDIKIGETPIGQFSGVQVQIAHGMPDEDWTSKLTLIPDDVHEESQSILLNPGVWNQRTSQTNAKELSIDVTLPDGLTKIENGRSSLEDYTININVEFKKTTDVSWTLAAGAAAVAATVTTNFTGTNNDLTFTRTVSGSGGNNYTVEFVQGLSVSVGFGILGILLPIITVSIVPGVTTAAQVKTAWDANPQVTAIATCANAPGNNGTGAINLPLVTFRTYGDRGSQYVAPYASFAFSNGADAVPSMTITGRTRALVRKSVKWDVEDGFQYDVRVRKATHGPDFGYTVFATAYWTMFRTIQASTPVLKGNMCMIALRIKATDQLNGVIDTLNVVAMSKLLDWDGTNWVLRATNNPASIYRDVLQGNANRRPKDDDQLDLATIQAFHGRCAANGYTFNAVIDFPTTVKQLRQDVLAAGRATFGLRDMKCSVVEDLLQSVPVDIITPRTSSGFKWTRRFLKMPHAFRVRFIDETENRYKQSERLVFADGYDETTALDYEETDAGLGVTNPDQVHKLKRRELADAVLRADDYEVTVDFANLNYTRGDRVQFQHDVILAGLVTARIKTVTLNGSSQATAITFDEPLVMTIGNNYGARIRKADGTQVVQQIVTLDGEYVGVTFTAPIIAANSPAAGDLVTFGLLGSESIDCIVKSIEPGADFQAGVKLQDYAPGIHEADTGPIPDYNSQVTWPDIPAPPIPTVVQVLSGEAVLVRDIDGSLQPRILVSVHFPSGLRTLTSRVETQFRETGSDDEWKVIFTEVNATSVEVPIAPVEEGLFYDIRLRSVDDTRGFMSSWALIDAHEVIGKTTPPPDVTNLVVEGDRLRWSYDSPPLDLGGFFVRFRAGTSLDWDSAVPAHGQAIMTTDFQIYRQATVATYLVKAVDVAGNLSTNAATVTVTFTDDLISNIVLEVDHDALGFPGTKTGCTVIGGDLKADSSGPFWTADTDPAYPMGAGDLYWVGAFGEMSYEFSYAPPSHLLDAILRIAITASGEYKLEYRPDSGASMWNTASSTLMWNADPSTLMWSGKGGYIAWPGELTPISSISYDFKVTISGGTSQGIIDQLSLLFDVQDIEESFSNFVISPGGTRLPLTKTYRTILVVNVTLNDDGGTAVYTKTLDKHATLGPLLEAYDIAEAATTGSVDVIVQGY